MKKRAPLLLILLFAWLPWLIAADFHSVLVPAGSDFTSGSDGDVLTVQADGSVQPEASAGGGGLDSNSWDATALMAEPSDSSFGLLAVRGIHHVITFDDTTSQSSLFRGVTSDSYTGGGFEIQLYVAAATATGGTLGIGIEFERVAVGDLDMDTLSFDTQITNGAAGTTVSGTSGVLVLVTFAVTKTTADELVAGDPFTLRVERLSGTTNDSVNGDMQIKAARVNWSP